MGLNNSTNASRPDPPIEMNSPEPSPINGIYTKHKVGQRDPWNSKKKSYNFPSRYYEKNEMASLSSNSESDANSGFSIAQRTKVGRKKGHIRPPMLLFTNLNKNLNTKPKKVNFERKKSLTSNPSQGETSDGRGSFDITDLEEEIDMILNDNKYGKLPWYHDSKQSSSSGTVSIKQIEDYSISPHEDYYSSRSLPTPSMYMYLAFDYDSKKSKSIEVLDAPNYFFLNFEEDLCPSDEDDDITKKEYDEISITNK